MPEELPKLPPATRQPGGIFILKGAKLGVPEGSFQISISETGKLKVEIDFHIGLDMTDRWLAIAEINQTKAIEAAGQLDLEWPSGNDEAAVPHLESEFFYSIQCVCASAFAIDAFYASVQEHIDIPPELRDAWKKNRTSRPARISDVLRRGFVFGEATSQKIRSALDEIFPYGIRQCIPRQRCRNLYTTQGSVSGCLGISCGSGKKMREIVIALLFP